MGGDAVDLVDRYGVERICQQLPIAPSTYYAHPARDLPIDEKIHGRPYEYR